jgi:hypothetical protein
MRVAVVRSRWQPCHIRANGNAIGIQKGGISFESSSFAPIHFLTLFILHVTERFHLSIIAFRATKGALGELTCILIRGERGEGEGERNFIPEELRLLRCYAMWLL